ncbi:MAG: type II 3-dehydroquinate dehydratase [Muribaculaceae bacterium]|nr:type II 3-dehydroquinate dehydratase [Muribaculaceae bacterium]
MAKVLIINGPNLNLLGSREPEIYGRVSMDDYLEALAVDYPAVEIEYFQSNHEGDIIDRLQEAGFDQALSGIVLNAGAYTHTSLAIADAIRAIERPVVEVHISNVAARGEELRHRSLIAPACRGTIAGFGMDSYRLGIEALL